MTDRNARNSDLARALALLPLVAGAVGLCGLLMGAVTFAAGAFFVGVLLWLAAGGSGLEGMPGSDRLPAPLGGAAGAAFAAADALVLAGFRFTMRRAEVPQLERIRDELAAARALVRERGWLLSPEACHHPSPPPPEQIAVRERRSGLLRFQHLSAPSSFAADPSFPGGERWRAEVKHRTNHAWCLRHAEPGRPWVVCVHGFGLGRPALDFMALSARRLHRRRGCNLLFPILNFHGPRGIGWRSGDGFFSGEVLDTFHAMVQSIHDIRSWMAWLRSESAEPPSFFGVSLGGYHAAAAAALEGSNSELGQLVLGVPMVDPAKTLWFHAPESWKAETRAAGIFEEDARELWSLTSPLSFPEPELRSAAIFSATADLLIPHPQLEQLIDHWPSARLLHSRRSHVTFRTAPEVSRFVDANLPSAR